MGSILTGKPIGSIFRFFRDIEFNAFKRPRSRRELVNRFGILGGVILAGLLPFLIVSSPQDVSEVAGARFLADLTALEASRTELDLLNDDPAADAATIETLEARIEDLEQQTFLGYIERDGDAPREGALVPDFRLLDIDGDPVQLSTLGKPAIVNFWASWCAFCIEEMPDLQRLHEAIGDRVTIIGINRGEAQGTARRFATQTGASYTLLLDLRDELAATSGPYRVIGMPTTFYVRADGRIDTVKIGFQTLEDLQELSASLLGEELDIVEQAVIDESVAGQVIDTLDSQAANNAVSLNLFEQFAADPTRVEDIAWQRNITAQVNIWRTNLARFQEITPPELAQALYTEVVEALRLLELAGTLLQTGIDSGDIGGVNQGIQLFNESLPIYNDAADDLRGFLATI
jgi:thiol-disulfide isomerase/thioredoxin